MFVHRKVYHIVCRRSTFDCLFFCKEELRLFMNAVMSHISVLLPAERIRLRRENEIRAADAART